MAKNSFSLDILNLIVEDEEEEEERGIYDTRAKKFTNSHFPTVQELLDIDHPIVLEVPETLIDP